MKWGTDDAFAQSRNQEGTKQLSCVSYFHFYPLLPIGLLCLQHSSSKPMDLLDFLLLNVWGMSKMLWVLSSNKKVPQISEVTKADDGRVYQRRAIFPNNLWLLEIIDSPVLATPWGRTPGPLTLASTEAHLISHLQVLETFQSYKQTAKGSWSQCAVFVLCVWPLDPTHFQEELYLLRHHGYPSRWMGIHLQISPKHKGTWKLRVCGAVVMNCW